jgi:uncharacterized repeat protein (TIGR03943 family)
MSKRQMQISSLPALPAPSILRVLLESSALLVWGSVLCYFYFSGRMESYLHPTFYAFVLGSGIVLIVLGLLAFFFSDSEFCVCDDPDCPDPIAGASLPRALSVWSILVVPLLWAATASPSQFGATAILNRGLVDSLDQLPGARASRDATFPTPHPDAPWANDPSMDFGSYLNRTEEGLIKTETIDLLFAAQEPPLRPDFENQDIEIIGQFLPERNLTAGQDDRFQLVRIFIMCCAADGRPIGVPIRGNIPPDLPEMTWLKIKGKATFPVQGGKVIPLVEAYSVDEIDPPRQTFIY